MEGLDFLKIYTVISRVTPVAVVTLNKALNNRQFRRCCKVHCRNYLCGQVKANHTATTISQTDCNCNNNKKLIIILYIFLCRLVSNFQVDRTVLLFTFLVTFLSSYRCSLSKSTANTSDCNIFYLKLL